MAIWIQLQEGTYIYILSHSDAQKEREGTRIYILSGRHLAETTGKW